MKKILLIVLALVLVLVGGIWMYLMFFGAPESTDELFADLGFGSESTPPDFVAPIPEQPVTEFSQTGFETNQALNRLTLRSTIGAVVVGTNTAMQRVRYTERGLGNMYEIDLTTNNERQLPGDPLTGAHWATWSPNGRYAVVGHEIETLSQVTLFDFGTTSETVTTTLLPPDISEVAFSGNNQTLYYTRVDNEGTLAYQYDLATNERSVWFSLPFSAAAISWSSEPLIYTKPGEGFAGYAYTYQNGSLNRVTTGGQQLTAFAIGEDVVVNQTTDAGYVGSLLTDGLEQLMAIPALPEKCVDTGASTSFWCAYPAAPERGIPIEWYKGSITLSDALWEVNSTNGTASLQVDLLSTSGQEIDVIDMRSDYTGTRLLFRDKNTYQLWLFDTTL